MSSWYFAGARWRPGVGSVPLDDRLFRFGDGCFDTLRVEDGRALFIAQHLRRLSLTLAHLHLPVRPVVAAVRSCIDSVPRRPGVCVLRLFVSAGRGGGLVRGRAEPFLFATLTPYVPPQERPLRVRTVEREAPLLAACKLPHYADAITLLHGTGADDLVFFDAKKRVLESSTGNVFCVLGGKLVTPPLDGRILPGVTRDMIQGLVPCQPKAITRAQLQKAEAVFLSSSVRGIAVVGSIDGKAIKPSKRGESLTRDAIAAYRQFSRL